VKVRGLPGRGEWLRAAVALGVVFVLAGLLSAADGGVAVAGLSGNVGEGQVVTLPAGTSAPAETRTAGSLAGLGFWVPVISSAFAPRFSDEAGTFTAGAGDELVFVSAELDTFHPPLGLVDSSYTGTTLTLRFAGHAVTLPATPSGSVAGVAGSTYGATGIQYSGAWVAAIPDGTPVTLTASEGGSSQTVDLRAGGRVGSAPVVSYRDAAGPLGLDVQPNLAGSLRVSTGSDHVSFPVTVKEAVLTDFRLDQAVPSAGLPVSEAYLLVSVTVGDGTGRAGQYYFDPADPRTAATMRVPGRGEMPAAFGPAFGGADEDLAGIYGFVVPATLGSVTLTVGPGSGQAVYFDSPDSVTPQADPVTASTAASFSLTFPPAARVPAAAAAAVAGSAKPVAGSVPSVAGGATSAAGGTSWTGVPSSTRGGVQAEGAGTVGRSSGGGGSRWLVVTAGAGGLTVAVLGLVVWRRRTRLVGPAPVKPVPLHFPVTGPAASNVGGRGRGMVGGGVDGADGGGVAVAALGSDQPPGGSGPSADIELVSENDAGGVPLLVVRVLGRLEVEGVTGTIRRRGVQRALVVLAVNYGRPVTSEELRGCMGSDEMSEPTATTLRSELSRLRSVLPDGVLPDQTPGIGYSLAGPVHVDWAAFKVLSAQAEACVGPQRLKVAGRALGLLRGPVLENSGWHGIERSVWEIEAAVEALAADTAERALAAGQATVAGKAAAQGLLAMPGSPGLWRLRLQAAKSGSGENVTVMADRARLLAGLA
jgi:hypothetical protein